MVIIRHQSWGTLLKGVLIRPSHGQQWQPKITQLWQQLQSIKETVEDVRDHHISKIQLYKGELESFKEDKSKIKRVVHELQEKQEGSKANLHHQVNQLEQRNAQLEAYNQYLEKRYQEGFKKVVASSQASTPEQFNPQSSHGTSAQSLQKAVQAKPVTRVVKSEVSLSGGSIVGKLSGGHVTQVIKAQPLDTEVTEPLGGACAFLSTTRLSGDQKPTPSGNKDDLSPGSHSQQSIAYKGEPPSPPNGPEVRPKMVDLSTTCPGSLPHPTRPPDGTQVPASAPKNDTLDCLGSTIHEQAPGNVYQGSSTSSWGVKAFPRIAKDCGPMLLGRHPTSIQSPSGSLLWSPTSREGTPPSLVQVPSSIVPCYPVGYGQFSPCNSNYGKCHCTTGARSSTIAASPW